MQNYPLQNRPNFTLTPFEYPSCLTFVLIRTYMCSEISLIAVVLVDLFSLSATFFFPKSNPIFCWPLSSFAGTLDTCP